MSQEAYVSIIVPVRNAERTIDTTLSYLTGLDYPNERLEIILADGEHRRDRRRHKTLAGEPSTHQAGGVSNCRTPGHARNAALKVAKGEFVLFTDGDCAPTPTGCGRSSSPSSWTRRSAVSAESCSPCGPTRQRDRRTTASRWVPVRQRSLRRH